MNFIVIINIINPVVTTVIFLSIPDEFIEMCEFQRTRVVVECNLFSIYYIMYYHNRIKIYVKNQKLF